MFDRNERLRELFRGEIIKALRDIKDPGISGLLTVTDVELSPDRKDLMVFYSVLGTPLERRRTDKALQRCAPYIHHLLIKRLALKLAPKVAFSFDDTPRRASRIDQLLGDIEKEHGA